MKSDILKSRIDGKIEALEIFIGKGVIVEKDVLITGNNGPASKVELCDFSYIGHQTRIMVPEFLLGDYSKLHAFSFIHGSKPMQIGRNCWIGGNVVLDSMGGLDIDDNVGIGAHSQFWTHIQFGDIVEGCRFFSNDYMYVAKDAWFVGHCIVSPIRVGEKSMALIGSVITKDMFPNHIYAGVPAVDVTHKLGLQFENKSIEQKADKLQELINLFIKDHPEYKGHLAVVRSPGEAREGTCCFDVSRRTYTKSYSPAEVAFLKAHIPLIKFIPDGEPQIVKPQRSVEPFQGDEI